MPLIQNCTQEVQSFKVYGNWFTLQPGKRKLVDDDKALFISMERKQNGIAVLPPSFEDPDYEKTEEGQLELGRLAQNALDGYIAYHRDIIRNNQVSLRRDLARADEKVDPAVEATEGELRSMEIVMKYQKSKDDTAQKKADAVKEMMKKIGPVN